MLCSQTLDLPWVFLSPTGIRQVIGNSTSYGTKPTWKTDSEQERKKKDMARSTILYIFGIMDRKECNMLGRSLKTVPALEEKCFLDLSFLK